MTSAATIRLQVESNLAHRIPCALTPAAKTIRPVTAIGIDALDQLLRGGLPVGAVTELVGPECSGKTSVAASFVAQMTRANKVCVWIDASDSFEPLGAAAAGVALERLLWVRCGVSGTRAQPSAQRFRLPETYLVPSTPKKGLYGGGFGAHPRSEVKGLAVAVGGLLRPVAPHTAEPSQLCDTGAKRVEQRQPPPAKLQAVNFSPWSRIEQALRSADLLLQAGGFSAIVLDLGSLAPEFVSRVPLATWHRYRLAAERTQSSILMLTQHSCAKSSAELLLRLHPSEALSDETTVFMGTKARIEVVRQRFAETPANLVYLRKPPQKATEASWRCATAWAGPR